MAVNNRFRRRWAFSICNEQFAMSNGFARGELWGVAGLCRALPWAELSRSAVHPPARSVSFFKICRFYAGQPGATLSGCRSLLSFACSLRSQAPSRRSRHYARPSNQYPKLDNTIWGTLFFGISRLFHFTTQTPSCPRRVHHSRHGRLHRGRNTDIRLLM
jgi:hypothetical protein